MKLKLSVLLAVLFSITATAFGQKETTTTKTTTKTETKTVETKTVEAKTPAAKTPTVKEILAKYVQAIGGREAFEKLKTRVSKGTQEIPAAGVKGTLEIYAAAPNKFFNKSNIAGIGEFLDSFDGKNAWTINPIQGSRDKSGEELAQAKLAYNFYRDINLDKIYPKMELKGTEKVGANDAYVVVATPPDNLPTETFYFDVKSGLLVRQDATLITPEGKTPTKTFYEDVREVDGVKLPFKIRTLLPQFEVVITTTEVKHNVAVEDAMFAKPKA